MRIVFFGTPDFAVPSLEALIHSGFEVVGVVTVADKPSGRGQLIQSSPIKKCALKHQIPVLQPEKLKDEKFIEELANFKADIHVIIAFRMLPEVVWAMPPLGSMNLHGSLLPYYRGAAPIQRAIMDGAEKTGLTTFFLKQEIDTGQLLLQKEIAILPNDNAGTLHDKMAQEGAKLVIESLKLIETGHYQLREQNWVEGMPLAKKIFKEDTLIDWNQNSRNIINHIRGLSPFPGAYFIFEGKGLKVFEAQVSKSEKDGNPGDIQLKENEFLVKSTNEWIQLLQIQIEGKKRMFTEDYLRGKRY